MPSDYIRGLEDGVELCLATLTEDLEKTRKKIEEYLGLLKERKLEQLKVYLWVLED